MLTREVPFKGLEGLQVAWLVVEKNEVTGDSDWLCHWWSVFSWFWHVSCVCVCCAEVDDSQLLPGQFRLSDEKLLGDGTKSKSKMFTSKCKLGYIVDHDHRLNQTQSYRFGTAQDRWINSFTVWLSCEILFSKYSINCYGFETALQSYS